jgi:hypothetical protein
MKAALYYLWGEDYDDNPKKVGQLDVGKEMPISRIVVAVPNATVVLLD